MPPMVAISVYGRPWLRIDTQVPRFSMAGSGRAEFLGGQPVGRQVGLREAEGGRGRDPASVLVGLLQLGVERLPQVVVGLPEHEATRGDDRLPVLGGCEALGDLDP